MGTLTQKSVALNQTVGVGFRINAEVTIDVRAPNTVQKVWRVFGIRDKGFKGNGDIAYYYTLGTKIDKIYVSEEVQKHLIAGRLMIVCIDGKTELLPRVIAEKIEERDPSLVVRVKKSSSEVDEDDPYADYKIPDDFTW